MIIFSSYILLLAYLKITLVNNFNKKRLFVVLAGFTLFLISSFRSINFGPPDVRGYVSSYQSLVNLNLSETWNYYFNGNVKDPFFYLFSKVISLMGAGYRSWLAILAGIFCFSVSKLIYKYSDEVYISFIALISLGYVYFSFTGLRQTIAISMVVISYKYLRERMWLPFLAIVILGSLFHSSALVFLLAYPLAFTKIGWKHFIVIIIALIIAFIFSNQLRDIIRIIGWTETLSSYADKQDSLTLSGFFIQLCIFLFCLFYKNEVLKTDNNNLSIYNLLFLGLVFQVFSTVIAEFFRISMYFSIFSIILIPKAIISEKDKYLKVVMYLAVLSALLGYIFWTRSFHGLNFFWQEW